STWACRLRVAIIIEPFIEVEPRRAHHIVLAGAPEIATYFSPPATDVKRPIFTKLVDDRPPGGTQGFAKFLVNRPHFLPTSVNNACATPVVHYEIHAPARKGLCVLSFVTMAADILVTGERPGSSIDAELQALRMQVVPQCLHVGKF